MRFQDVPGGSHFQVKNRSDLGTYIKLADGFIQDDQSVCYIHYPDEDVTRHPFNAVGYDGTPSVFEPEKSCTIKQKES